MKLREGGMYDAQFEPHIKDFTHYVSFKLEVYHPPVGMGLGHHPGFCPDPGDSTQVSVPTQGIAPSLIFQNGDVPTSSPQGCGKPLI